MTRSFQKVLLLCSGNFYRSRFAEALFNHRATIAQLNWRADSKGFKPHIEADHDISPFARDALTGRRISLNFTRSKPAKVEEADFWRSHLVVAMLQSEHRPAMRARFPDWEDLITYWNICDIDMHPLDVALPMLRRRDCRLVELLSEARKQNWFLNSNAIRTAQHFLSPSTDFYEATSI